MEIKTYEKFASDSCNLETCPFCGSIAERMKHLAGKPYSVCCEACGGHGPRSYTEAEAIVKWNGRPHVNLELRGTAACDDGLATNGSNHSSLHQTLKPSDYDDSKKLFQVLSALFSPRTVH